MIVMVKSIPAMTHDIDRPEVYELYEKIVDWFDRHRYKGLMEQEYLDLVLKTIPNESSILDLGCGTAEPIAKFFIERGYRVTGVDASQRMVERCQTRFPQAKFLCADMRSLMLTETFDAILAWDSFFHLSPEDQRRMFPVFQAHIKPEGILVFTSGFGSSTEEVYGEMDGYQFYHATLATEEYERLLKEHGFQVLRYTVQDPQCGDHTVWVTQAVGRTDS